MAMNRHDLVLTAARLGQYFGQALAHTMGGQVAKACIPAPALEHGRHAVTAGKRLARPAQHIGCSQHNGRACGCLEWRQERGGDLGRAFLARLPAQRLHAVKQGFVAPAKQSQILDGATGPQQHRRDKAVLR